jgi:TM2 domain-containing membrane protein YozV
MTKHPGHATFDSVSLLIRFPLSITHLRDPAMQDQWEGVMIECPWCQAEINTTAMKCRHCGEFVKQSAAMAHAPPGPRKSPGIAALLSLVIPGAGQMYRERIFTGFAWLAFVSVGYLAFFFPGLILHFCCIIAATMDD